MTIAELLAQYGLDEPKTTSFLADMKANKIFTASEENMDIRHGKLKGDFEAQGKQLQDANALIEQLQKNNKNNEDLQKSVTDYQARLAAAEKQAALDRLKYNLKLEFITEGVEDADYVLYKALEKHPEWKENPLDALDENGKVKSREELLSGLKTQLPTMFKAGGKQDGDGYQVYEPNNLPKGDPGGVTPTKEAFKAMSYEQRVALKQKNEKLYKQLAKD
jgi:hypothetical protein